MDAGLVYAQRELGKPKTCGNILVFEDLRAKVIGLAFPINANLMDC